MRIVSKIFTFCITAVFVYLLNFYLRLTVAALLNEELFNFTKLTSDTDLDLYNASILSEKAVKTKANSFRISAMKFVRPRMG